MRFRQFGRTELLVSEIGVGCSRLGGMFSGTSPKEEADLLTVAMDAGINLFDTSDLYSHGQSEILLGRAVKRRRSEILIASKGGYVRPGETRLLSRAKPLLRPVVRALGLKRPASRAVSSAPIEQDFSPQHLVAGLEGSLRRLQTDYIDIYQLHSPPRDVVDAGEFIPVLDELKAQGKLRHYGIAADDASDVESFDRHPSIESLQVPFSVLDQGASGIVFPKAAAAGTGVISRSCFAAGLLVSSVPEPVLREQTADWKEIIAFRSKAEELGRSPSQLALQWNLGVAPIAVTIIGMRTHAHLAGVLRDAEAPALSSVELESLTGTRPT
jgi:aryl-alcohol dehydrogenase-like predicted oxidoreductase